MKAWSIHKVLCKALKDSSTHPPAEASKKNYTRAIYFHPFEDTPRFVWLKTERILEDDCENFHIRSADLLANDETEAESEGGYVVHSESRILYNYAVGRRLPHPIIVRYREDFLHDGSQSNRATHRVVDLRSRYLHDWRGPLIAYGTSLLDDSSLDSQSSVDFTPADLRCLSHWLNAYYFLGANSILDTRQELDQGTVGVRINCLGDEKVGGRPKFEPVKIPAYDWIFEEEVIPIPERLELLMVTQRIPGSVEHWEKRSNIDGECSLLCNHAATSLHLRCDPKVKQGMHGNKYSWGLAPLEWQDKVGSVIVMRKDKKPLLPGQVAALVEYCQVRLPGLFQEQKEHKTRDNDVLKEISKDKFVEYYNVWQARQSKENKQDHVSPYKV
jgi:hypothetical protein